MSTQYTIDEIKEGCAPLWNNIECMTCSRLLSYIDHLLSLVKDGGAEVIEGPSSTEYDTWLKTRPDLLARLKDKDFTIGAGYEIWRNSWLRLREMVTAPTETSARCGEFKPSILGVLEPQDRCVLPAGHKGKHSLDTTRVFPASTEQAGEPEMSLADMLKLRKELDPDAPDMIVMSAAPATPVAQPEADPVDEYDAEAFDEFLRTDPSAQCAMRQQWAKRMETAMSTDSLLEALKKVGCSAEYPDCSTTGTMNGSQWVCANHAVSTRLWSGIASSTATPTSAAVEARECAWRIVESVLNAHKDCSVSNAALLELVAKIADYLPAQQPEVQSDIETDLRERLARCEGSRRVHELDNHHNALACGYCAGPIKEEIARLKGEVERLNSDVARFSTLADERHDLLCAERRHNDEQRWRIVGIEAELARKSKRIEELKNEKATARAAAIGECAHAIRDLSADTFGTVRKVDALVALEGLEGEGK